MSMLRVMVLVGAAMTLPAWADGPTVGDEATPATPTTTPAEPATTMPATAPATAPAKAATPATDSAEAARAKLFGESPKATLPPAPATTVPGADTVNLGAVQPVGPNEPKVKTLLEGTLIYKRVGRLSKDAKSGQYLFTFDADGKDMRDPPMVVLPSKTLAAMESLSDNGSRPVRFQITGEVTEYKGRNYLLVHAVLVLRDLNQGIGGT